MNNAIIDPLQSLLNQAAKTLPPRTDEMDTARRRITGASELVAIVCDCSGSMDAMAWGGRRKIDLLREAVKAAWSGQRIVCFEGARIESVSTPDAIFSPGGSTPLHSALESIASGQPRHTLVISDGQPDDEALALAAADRLTGTIDVLYVGPDTDKAAIDFMRRLARIGGGRVVVNDVARPQTARPQLAQSIRGLLP